MLLSAAFLLALVLAGVIVAVAGGGSRNHGTSAGPRPVATARAGADTTAQPAGECSLPAGDQSVPYSSPPGGVTWAQVGTIEVPQAPGALGPEHTSADGSWNMCFADSPSGALLAAFNFWAEGTLNRPAQVFERYAADAPAKRNAIAA